MKTALLMASAAVVIAVVPPAHADITGIDQAFLTTLGQAGLVYMSPDRAITAAKSVCELVDEGMRGVEIVQKLQDSNPGFEGDGAAKFAALAAQAYCPQKLTGGDDAATAPKGGDA
jgi:hypothetical protein